ncbi:hypothetical protein [Flavivirga jejuensis]|uniref:Ig-like domain-containing protein n=1 Tax=Flavivirga jejuensis TaxID=870487 RepID=A0ABT8WP10_9FLAO|nr:hypothetical protein [Flavivirga jejuensis]MDO5974914.1 hypothetical protein [Flavivirga jejuensis]
MGVLHLIGKITCNQSYASHASRGLRLVPTYPTQSLFQREELWLHQAEGTIEIYTKKINLSSINPSTFMFWVEVTDPQFYNYIDLPDTIINRDYLLCFVNEKEEELLIPKKEAIKNIQRKLQVVVFEEMVEKDEQIRVFDNHGDMVYEEMIPVGRKTTVLDLTQEEEGFYTWTFNGFSDTFFLTDKNLKHTIGICQFQLKSEAVHQISIQFETKKTYWEYLVISKKEHIEDIYTIIDNDGTYTFTCQGKVTMMGLDAISYLSDQKIPYKERPKTRFKLVSNTENETPYLASEDRILPNASPENIKIHSTEAVTEFKTQTIIYI